MHEIHERELEEIYRKLIALKPSIDEYISSLYSNPKNNLTLIKKIEYLFKNRNSSNLDTFDSFMEALYQVETEEYIVGFLDILGFKNMLASKKFGSIMRLFEKIADSIYSNRRRAYNSGLHVIEPKVANFSDSIIIYSKLFRGGNEEDNQFVFSEFSLVIRDIVAESLKLGIPIRGAVSIGSFYTDEVESYELKSVSRYGVQHGAHGDITEKHSTDIDSHEAWKKRILSPVKFPIHFGDALTDSYILESGIESIGVFMDDSMRNHPLLSTIIKININFGNISEIVVDGNKFLSYNWCNRISRERYEVIKKHIKLQAEINEGRVAKKWKSLESSLNCMAKK